MLRHLRVTNFAILSDVAIELGPGFNVLSGETGAGKSLIVEAVNLLRGGRASADIPREGADEAVVEAIVEVPADLRASVERLLDDAGVPSGEPEVLIRRVIHRGGRSRTYVNGGLTTARRLADLGALLVDLSGQHQHQGLVDPRRHRDILDSFSDDPAPLERMRTAWAGVRETLEAIERLGGDERALAERVDYLRFQLEEIEGARLEAGEDDDLGRERSRLQSVDRLQGGAARAEELLYSGDDAAVDRLGAAAREVERLTAIDDSVAEQLRQIQEARALAEDAAGALRHYLEGLDAEPGRLDQVESRLALISRLERKHGATVAGILARAAELGAELDDLGNREARLAELEARRAAAGREAGEAAGVLSAARAAAAARLIRDVETVLADLGMAAARLEVKLEPREVGPEGAERVEFLLAANTGERAKPLAKIASGGELSRIMLALKLALRHADEVATYVFDEVDAGIGGAAAQTVGAKIRELSRQRQVLCVTHLPQIAAFADRHFHVAKSETGGRTETEVTQLDADARRAEMARMLGGTTVTEHALAHADEMLSAASGAPPRRRKRAAS
jgi:DNA repair protein RecN (Recombination protein N)